MEVDHDLRKFITELPVAQRCAVLSSGREADRDDVPHRVTVRGRNALVAGRAPARRRTDRDIEMWGGSLRGRGSSSSTELGSDQTAPEALQEAETEVGATGMVDREANVAARGAGQTSPIGLPFDRLRPYGPKVSRFVPARMQENRCSWWKDGDRGNCVGGNDNASDLAAGRRAY
ncbi:hypothetical protein [Actinoplanes sp. N902-109]|uniref:hypothetical protein n=1 Tax=Actinoplanes sp. (strain N902-109) TaxID=649831 RepID=UPI0018DB7B7E|nr:hypothetical protein [Actinoplanes sp. N902-109]